MVTLFSLSWFIAALIVILAITIQGLTGFGGALILVPLLVVICDTHTAVELSMVITFYSLFTLAVKVRKSILKPMVGRLFLGSLAGIFLGTYAFIYFDVTVLKIIIVLTTLIFSVSLYFNWVPRRSPGILTEAGIGAVSGFLGSSVGMPGPPVVLFLNYQDLPKEQFRATVSAYFSLVYLISLAVLLIKQIIDLHIILIAFTLAPFALLGQLLGFLLFPRISQELFHRGIPLLITVLALYSLVTAIF